MAGATSRISKVLVTGPLAPFAEDYRRELRERGYTERSAVNQLRQVARFTCWLQASQLSVPELSADRVEVFLGWQRAVGRHRSQWSRPGLACLLDVLRELGVLGAGEPARADSPAQVLLAGFGRYLAAERGLAAGTVRGYVGHARRSWRGCRPVPAWPACAPRTLPRRCCGSQRRCRSALRSSSWLGCGHFSGSASSSARCPLICRRRRFR